MIEWTIESYRGQERRVMERKRKGRCLKFKVWYSTAMPRQVRIDLRGHLYHVMGRGIEQRDIFIDARDYADNETVEALLRSDFASCP